MPGVLAACAAAIGFRRTPRGGSAGSDLTNPLQLAAALEMALLFQVVLMLVQVAGRVWGQAGVLTSAAVLGLTDVDALTVSMARGVAYTVSLEVAAIAIAVGVLSNTVLKLAVALFLGNRTFKTIVGGTLALMIVAAAAALALLGP
jgi:uncharacterized membrane protein (DUF4010 family)